MTSPSIAARPVRLVFTAVNPGLCVFWLCGCTTVAVSQRASLRCSYAEQCVRLLSSNANALLRVAPTFCEFWLLLTGFVVSSRRPMILYEYSPPPRPLRGPASASLWSRFAERRRCLLWLWAAWHAPGRATAGTPPPRSLKTSRKEQEFDHTRATGQPQRHNGACRLRHPINTGRRR